MPLSPDLSASIAKIARARVHLDALKAELPALLEQRGPDDFRISEIDPNSGWCSVFMTPRDFPEPLLGIIVGDFMHNLRCALDYVVSALVDASGEKLSDKHQFPIYTSQSIYQRNVGTRMSAHGPCIHGIKHGLAEFWNAQPFNRKPDPEADPLFTVYRFSNADKHRKIPAYASAIVEISGGFDVGQIVEEQIVTVGTPLEPNREYEVRRYRFARPYPSEARLQADVPMRVYFTTPPFGQHRVSHRVSGEELMNVCDHVAMVVDSFKSL